MPSLRTSHRAGWFQQSFLRYKLLLGYKLLHWFKFQVLSDNSHINAHHSSRTNSELNDMIQYYERLLLDREQDVMAWKDKSSSLESDLRSSTEVKQKLEDQLENLSSKLMQSNGELQDQYQRYDKIQEELSNARGRLSESESNAYDLSNQLSKLQAKSASKARKEVKGHGIEWIQGAIVFIQTEKTRTELESDIKEYESNLLLLDQTHDEDFSEEQERSELKAVLAEKRSRLAALPSSSFNPQQFEEFFTESPPLSESGLDWTSPSDPVEPEVPIMSVVTPEPVATPPEILPSTNTVTVVIEDDDGSESGIPTEQPVTDVTDETETQSWTQSILSQLRLNSRWLRIRSGCVHLMGVVPL
ncbi:myosin heavy chain-like protein [Arabidopsis thaliana]|uniref:Myosin heavy chain-like protein n=1 Tax=Arabidopsis thaliana TaxID=3702 RepID=F4JA81_ARATH|nr:myosin heavy chain-like protein [Arabidopsis thaliana]AEE77692.1 myosin heavy chain-like protein [Arabidopsis thaliana]|eukprot:NP_189761.1 myosin heavy chain-like protein [Arabidopsis thaliana]